MYYELKTVEFRGKKIKLQIWDSAGTTRFQDLTISSPIFRRALGIILVYDITEPKSFENISTWLQDIDKYANQDVEKMLLGNKCDMEDKRQVSKDRGETVRYYIILFYKVCSSCIPCTNDHILCTSIHNPSLKKLGF